MIGRPLSYCRVTLALAASALFASLGTAPAAALEPSPVAPRIDTVLAANRAQLVEWRRHLHQNPELGNREVETAKFVVERLRSFGLEPRTGVARTGVVAVIEGGRPGPVVALRADMDALPVTEEVDLPFASKATATWEGHTVGVMHACGHDTHVAMLLDAAKALASVRKDLPGKILLVFQPAEESVPLAEQPAGAELMLKEGVFDDPRPDVVFGLHAFAQLERGVVGYRSGPFMAAADRFEIVVQGRQAHGSKPWVGIDPIVVGSEIVTALQTVVSRTVDLTREPAVVTVGQFDAGVRNNIIPDRARLVGTIRTFDETMRSDIHARVRRIAEGVAAAHGTTVRVAIERGYPVTRNDSALTERMLPTLERVAPGKVRELPKVTGAEDFSFFANRVPGLFVMVGVTPLDQMTTAASNHSPLFYVDETALPTGSRALAQLAADYLFAKSLPSR
jgi:amidohydrolase